MTARIRKDDIVYVISGKDKGRTGRVLQVFPKEGKCIVEKVGIVKRHQKAKQAGQPAGIIEKGMKIALSKVMPFDSHAKKPSRVRINITKEKTSRIWVKSGKTIEAA